MRKEINIASGIKSKFFIVITFLVIAQISNAQSRIAESKYWVYFSDKKNSTYLINQPAAYLTERAIQRREKMHIPIKISDLPVNASYIKTIADLGITIQVESRWLNAVSITIHDPSQLNAIRALPFVRSVVPVRSYIINDDDFIPVDNTVFYKMESTPTYPYGPAFNQNHMIDVDYLHTIGFTGQGMQIAVLDGGFDGVNDGPGFQSFWDKDQIIDTINFPGDTTTVFYSATHGSNVLSIMGCDLPGTYVGSGPDARFYLFRTEIVYSERVVEEDYWLEAAEYADFVGADIINSSLGYTTFDDTTENHTYADMDGNTTVITRAADMAAAAGILVCSSAGNEGDNEWHYISAPADGDSVFTIGAVDLNGNYASFSSQGPTVDGRIKPNVAGQGAGTAVMDQSGVVYFGNGTSYSSPLIAGACASLWSAFPEKSNMEIIDAIQRTATQSNDPDNFLGYGIPSFARAYYYLKGIEIPQENVINIIPNPVADDITTVLINGNETSAAIVELFNMAGQVLQSYQVNLYDGKLTPVAFTGLNAYATGIYFIRVTGDIYTQSVKMMIK